LTPHLFAQLAEEKMHQKLLKVFQEVHPDNQDVLGILLAAKDELPLKNSSTQDKVITVFTNSVFFVWQPNTHARRGKTERKRE
jgi:hypothetical protein